MPVTNSVENWSTRKKIFIIHGKGRIGGEGEEVGGDLDTIISNVFYGAWCRGMVQQIENRAAIYGQDFEFDYVNYHEGLAHLSIHSGCNVYLPDFPLDAIPDIKSDVVYLRDHDVSLVRIDDHHPWTPESIQKLIDLKEEGLLDDFVVQGPQKGEEMAKEDQVCGADLVYRQFIENSPFENSGLKELRRLAHIQDLHIEFDEMAINLSKLIGSGHTKIDMVLRLMDVSSIDDVKNILKTTGWDKEIRAYDKGLKKATPKLRNNMALIELYRPTSHDEQGRGILKYDEMKGAIGLFKIIAPVEKILKEPLRTKYMKWLYSLNKKNMVRVVVALAPFRAEGEVKINVAAAIEYVSSLFSLDYFLYCYGSFLMTTRNVSDEAKYLDLSLLMAFIGGEGDGGHKEAATCKPTKNPDFDPEKFARVNSGNFLDYVAYLASKIQAFSNLELKKVRKIGN